MNGLVIALFKATGLSTSSLCWQHRPLVNFVNSLSSLRHLVRVRPEVTAARQLAAFTIWTEHDCFLHTVVQCSVLCIYQHVLIWTVSCMCHLLILALIVSLSCTSSNVRNRVIFFFYVLPCFWTFSWSKVEEWGWIHIVVWFTHIEIQMYQSFSALMSHCNYIHCCFPVIIKDDLY